MPIRIGTENDPAEIYVGTESIGEVYVGTELVWQKDVALPVFAASFTYDGGTIGGTTTSTAASQFTVSGTDGVAPTGFSISGLNHGAGTAGSNASESAIRTQNTFVAGVTTRNETSDSGFLPATNQIFASQSYTQTRRQQGTDDTTASGRNRTYQYTSSGPTTGGNTTRSFTLTGTIPTGYQNAGDAITPITVTATQSGRTGSDNRTGSVSTECGTVSSGVNQSCFVSNNDATSVAYTDDTNQAATGTGTFTFSVTNPSSPVTDGDTITSNIATGSFMTSHASGGSGGVTYSWVLTGPISPLSSTSSSYSGTTSGTGTVNGTLSGSFSTSNANATGGTVASTFTASDAFNAVTVESAALPCNSRTTTLSSIPTGADAPVWQPNGFGGNQASVQAASTGDNCATNTATSSTAFAFAFDFAGANTVGTVAAPADFPTALPIVSGTSHCSVATVLTVSVSTAAMAGSRNLANGAPYASIAVGATCS